MFTLNTAATIQRREGKKKERLKQHLEIGGQADDGQVSQFVPLCGGQLWECGCSLCTGRNTPTFSRVSKREENTQVAPAWPLLLETKPALTSMITLKSFKQRREAVRAERRLQRF